MEQNVLISPENLFKHPPTSAFFELFDVLSRFNHVDWFFLSCLSIGILTFLTLFVGLTPLRKPVIRLLNHFESLLEKGNDNEKNN